MAWVEEKLDHVLVNRGWCDLFGRAVTYSLEVTESNYLPLLLVPIQQQRQGGWSRFYFKTVWLNNLGFKDVVRMSWEGSVVSGIQVRVLECEKMVARWGEGIGV